jgi:hypothetical protein
VASKELLESWKQTEALLKEAKSNLNNSMLKSYSDALKEFDEYIIHNEFGLALDMLEYVIAESEEKSAKASELLLKAKKNMGLNN